MDPLTHTLVGASLAATRLGRTTRLAAPALVVGANLPDVDVLSYFAGSDAALAFRRGWTHGPAALVVLPAVLAALLWAWGRRRGGAADGRPLAAGRLAGLCYLSCLTHPALDWLNTYGMRWGMPWSARWFYGDAVYIMDPWLWLILGGAWLLARRPGRGLLVTFAVLAALLVAVVAARAPLYLPLVAAVAVVLLAALVWRPPARLSRRTLAVASLAAGAGYVAVLMAVQGAAESRVRAELERLGVAPVEELMVGPVPADPLSWDVVVGSGGAYRWGRFRWLSEPALELAGERLPAARIDPLWQRVEQSGAVPGFRLWARFPWLESEPVAGGLRVYLMDARYVRRRAAGGFGAASVTLPPADP